MKSVHTYYEGKVQGVGFRASVLSIAKGFDLTGWVKNLSDGRVEVFVTGDEMEIIDFLRRSVRVTLPDILTTAPHFPDHSKVD